MNQSKLPILGNAAGSTIASELSLDVQDTARVARSVFGLLHHAQNSALGDLYDLYILLALSHQKAEDGTGTGPRGLNLFSISEMTGVPRETVRRRLHRLIESGYASVCDDRTYTLRRIPSGFEAALANLQERLAR